MTRYSRELSDLLCEQLAAGRTLRAVCQDDGMPSRQAVQKWIAGDVDGFAERYEQARRLGYEAMADEVVDLADDAGLSNEAVAKARLQVDSRKWLLAKALPKAFGERVTLAGDPEAPLVIEDQRPPLESFLLEFAGRVATADAALPAPAPVAPVAIQPPPPLPPEPAPARAAPRRERRVPEPEQEPQPPPRRAAQESEVDHLAAYRGSGRSDWDMAEDC